MGIFDRLKKPKTRQEVAQEFFDDADMSPAGPHAVDAVIADKARGVEYFPGSREGLSEKQQETIKKLEALYEEVDSIELDPGLKSYLRENAIKQTVMYGGIHESMIPTDLKEVYSNLKPKALEIYGLQKEIKEEEMFSAERE